jgi:hypothetical protein
MIGPKRMWCVDTGKREKWFCLRASAFIYARWLYREHGLKSHIYLDPYAVWGGTFE